MKRLNEDESAVVRYLSAEEEAACGRRCGERDADRRRVRDSANAWRRERGYEPGRSTGRYTDHLTPLVLLALNTGLRRGELFQLRWHDVQLKRGC